MRGLKLQMSHYNVLVMHSPFHDLLISLSGFVGAIVGGALVAKLHFQSTGLVSRNIGMTS